MKRSGWLESLASTLGEDPALEPAVRDDLSRLDEALFDAWNLGENIILAWTEQGDARSFLLIRHYAVLEPFGVTGRGAANDPDPNDFMHALLAQSKQVLPSEFAALATRFGRYAHVVRVPVRADVDPELVSGVVRRYSVTLVRERAVMLLDAVGFSLHSPLEQVAMLNSLSYSVNSAYRQLVSGDVQVNFARSSTGDGFYLWNRARTPDAVVALYKLMMLVLADNAVARSKAKRFPVPQLRAAFHVGEHYEFCQVEALNPTTFSYIVGHVTIELARMLDHARPGQILLGDFTMTSRDPSGGPLRHESTLEFMDRAQAQLHELEGMAVANDRITGIRCYVTGRGTGAGSFEPVRYEIADKHGRSRPVYNAKINIHLADGAPIFLGLQHRDLHPESAAGA